MRLSPQDLQWKTDGNNMEKTTKNQNDEENRKY
jgi:hypothetical protein